MDVHPMHLCVISFSGARKECLPVPVVVEIEHTSRT